MSLSSGQFHPIFKESTISTLLKKYTLDKDKLSTVLPLTSPSHKDIEQAPRLQHPGLQTVHIFAQRKFVADFLQCDCQDPSGPIRGTTVF